MSIWKKIDIAISSGIYPNVDGYEDFDNVYTLARDFCRDVYVNTDDAVRMALEQVQAKNAARDAGIRYIRIVPFNCEDHVEFRCENVSKITKLLPDIGDGCRYRLA